MNRAEWIWMPHPGHFICARDCKFHLTTCVGGYLVSTIGEMFPDSRVREIFAESRGVTLEGRGDVRDADYMRKIGFEPVGYKRLYETMVFKAAPCTYEPCCPWRMANGEELECIGYNDPGAAARGHLEACERWSNK